MSVPLSKATSYERICNGMLYTIGDIKKSHSGICINFPDLTSILTDGSAQTYKVPPLALTSSRLEINFSAISLSGA